VHVSIEDWLPKKVLNFLFSFFANNITSVEAAKVLGYHVSSYSKVYSQRSLIKCWGTFSGEFCNSKCAHFNSPLAAAS
jgi:hypothetical protein